MLQDQFAVGQDHECRIVVVAILVGRLPFQRPVFGIVTLEIASAIATGGIEIALVENGGVVAVMDRAPFRVRFLLADRGERGRPVSVGEQDLVGHDQRITIRLPRFAGVNLPKWLAVRQREGLELPTDGLDDHAILPVPGKADRRTGDPAARAAAESRPESFARGLVQRQARLQDHHVPDHEWGSVITPRPPAQSRAAPEQLPGCRIQTQRAAVLRHRIQPSFTYRRRRVRSGPLRVPHRAL